MSVAGKREGIKHSAQGDEDTTRSGLFYEAVRIIREMLEATNGEYPKYAVWENVPGAFSSNKGWDFYSVLEALCSLCNDTVSISKPYDKRKRDKLVWEKSGEIVGDNYSLCWRTLDAQYWGVPQRRKRIYLVLDFNTQFAREILFKPDSLRGNMPQSNNEGQRASVNAVGGADGSVGVECLILKERAGCDGGGKGALWSDNAFTLAASQDMSVIAMATQQGGAELAENLCPTITAAAGMSGNNQPVIALQGNGIDRADTAGCNGCGWRENDMYTLNTVDRPAVCYDARNHVSQDISGTLQVKTNGGASLNFINPVCFQNTGRGWWNEGETAECLRTPSGGDSTKANLVCYDARGNGDGDLVPTLTGDHQRCIGDYTALAVQESPCTASGKQCFGTLQASCADKQWLGNQEAISGDYHILQKANPPRRYIIRRLMPVECGRLQGFPDWWGQLAPYNPSDAEFWENVRKTYAEINGKSYKPVKNLKRWYEKLHTDSAEYKMWGNGIALPNAEYVLCGIAERGAKTLGSLFDGSGGFPLAGALHGITPLWASEVEPYPIAVTMSRFRSDVLLSKQIGGDSLQATSAQ